MGNKIIIKGARENNLKNINLEIPKEKFVVITGLSGSGKSSLAFDTLYAEGQRRYVESLSTYARQFLGQLKKPDVDFIDGLSPAISIEQKGISHNPRSTIGTVTEIYDYFRLLFARIGKPYCYNCGREISSQSPEQIVNQITGLGDGIKIMVMAPVVVDKKGEFRELFRNYLTQGFVRFKIDGEIKELESPVRLKKHYRHNIDVIVDRLVLRNDVRTRLTDSVEQAIKISNGQLKVFVVEKNEEMLFSVNLSCPYCGISYPEIEPKLFSFNSPYGACEKCNGLGISYEIADDSIFQNKNLPFKQALSSWFYLNSLVRYQVKDLYVVFGYDFRENKITELSEEFYGYLLNGYNEPYPMNPNGHSGKVRFWRKFDGLKKYLFNEIKGSEGFGSEKLLSNIKISRCSSCGGARLKNEALNIKINGKNIYDVTSMSVKKSYIFFNTLELTEFEKKVVRRIIKEINSRLRFLIDVGLDYLTLERSASTLSGGESQRIRLATQIGARLSGVLYVLDEPSIGLHQKDNLRLINSLKNLRDIGNSVIVVEHDEETMLEADYIIDLGPGAGNHGGKVVAFGTPEDIMNDNNSLTGKYLARKKRIPFTGKRRELGNEKIIIKNAKLHNLKNINVEIPIGVFVAITGVSGSGKSTLLFDLLYPSIRSGRVIIPDELYAFVDEIVMKGWIDKVIQIDQSPIGRTPRSNPATYVGIFDRIRDIFAEMSESKIRGYKKGRFSFNISGGRCEKCKGDGLLKIEMHFLPDVYIQCDECHGKRYNRDTLEIKFKGKDISDILNMTVNEATEFFRNHSYIKRKLELLQDVGLGYLKLGQSSTTLSGGEAQRIKLTKELSRRQSGKNIYILDEPTTGLHFEDIKKLNAVLQKLVDLGNTVIVIEHNLDVIKVADYVVDLGPEGGENGGMIVAKGSPEEIIKVKKSYTGKYLKEVLKYDN